MNEDDFWDVIEIPAHIEEQLKQEPPVEEDEDET
jgi:hypothetical protein